MTCAIQKLKAEKKLAEAFLQLLQTARWADLSSTRDQLGHSLAPLINLLSTGRRKRNIIVTAMVKPLIAFPPQENQHPCGYRHDGRPFAINHTRDSSTKTPPSSPADSSQEQRISAACNPAQETEQTQTVLSCRALSHSSTTGPDVRMSPSEQGACFATPPALFTFPSNALLQPLGSQFPHYAMTGFLFLLLYISGRQT